MKITGPPCASASWLQRSHKERGFTLLELLLSLALGAFLMTTLYQVWMDNSVRRSHMQESAALQESGRSALHLLRHFIQKTGYIDWVQLSSSHLSAQEHLRNMQRNSHSALQTLYGPQTRSLNHLTTGTYSTFSAHAVQQALEIQYQETYRDCLGQSGLSGLTRLRFFLRSSSRISNLYCQNLDKGSPQPVVEGVEEMVFVFFEDGQWVSTPQRAERVSAVHVCLVLSSTTDRSEGLALMQPQRPTCTPQAQGILSRPDNYAPDLARESRDNKRWLRVHEIIALPNNFVLDTPSAAAAQAQAQPKL